MNTFSNTDGRKRCKCKKSECLKLYCDCFAAGFYCDGRCSCQGCYNIPEYEDTVDMTREKIELRNPLAFSPKIRCLEYGDQLVGQHQKGCNCRKSMCLRKYCECYRAKVGCSVGCSCRGCRNVYGKKGEYNVRAIHDPDIKASESIGLPLPEFHNHPNLTPFAPPPYHGVDTSTVRLFTPPPGYDRVLGTSRGNIPLDQHPNVEFRDQFIPPQDTNVISMMNLPPVNVMEWPKSSRDGGSSLPVAVTPPPPGYEMMLGTRRGNIHLDQHPNVELMDQFTPPQDTNAISMRNLPSVNVLEWPNSSRAGGSSLPVAVTPPPGYDKMLGTRRRNIHLDQHPNVELMDQFKPPQDTNAISMMNLPPVNVMERPNSSRDGGPPPPGYDKMLGTRRGNVPLDQNPNVEFMDEFTPPQDTNVISMRNLPPLNVSEWPNSSRDGGNSLPVAVTPPPPGFEMMLGTRRGNILLNQHPNVEFMDEFTPPQDTNVISMMNLPPVNVMQWTNSSRAGGSSLPVAVTPVCLFGGNGNPIIDTNSLNNHSIPDAGSSTTSPVDK